VFSHRTGAKFAPFLIAIVLFVAVILSPYTGIGPNSNSFALFALVMIIIGLIIGVVSLYRDRTTRIRWRILVGLLYLPAALFSVLVAGF
jgi:amino acid transporter